MLRQPSGFTLFPYTTLFRSVVVGRVMTTLIVLRAKDGIERRELRFPARGFITVVEIEVSRPVAAPRPEESFRQRGLHDAELDRKSTRLNSSHSQSSYAVFCLNVTAAVGLYTLSLHDALPICGGWPGDDNAHCTSRERRHRTPRTPVSSSGFHNRRRDRGKPSGSGAPA